MKIVSQFLVFAAMLVVSVNSFSLTCPEQITFTCKKADPSRCPGIDNPTLCTLAGLGQIWDFIAPDRALVNSNNGQVPGKSSCSVLSEKDYTASYGLSYYGQVSDGKGGYITASYCLYIINDGDLSLAGLISKDYAYNPNEGTWIKKQDGWACQDAKGCGFIKLLPRG